MDSFSSAFTIDVRRLRVLRELRERGTVGATAEALHLTPSAISQQLSSLSREVGVPLLTPQGRGVRLTPQAQLLLEHATAIDAQLERARADLEAFGEGLTGHVSVGCFATGIGGLVATALARLRRERPGLRLTIHEVDAPECFSRLDRGELDLVVTVDYRGGPHRGDRRYARHELLDDPYLVALPVGHALAGRKTIDLPRLADQPWVVGAVLGPCQEAGLAACAAAGFTPDIAHRVNDWVAVLALVAARCGVALVPRLAVTGPLPRGVVLRQPGWPQRPARHIYAATRAGAERSPSIGPVVDVLAAVARDLATSSPRGRWAPRRP